MPLFPIFCVQCLNGNIGDDASSFVFVSLTIRLSLPVRQDAFGSVVHLSSVILLLFFLTNVHFGYKTHLYPPQITLVLLVEA